MPGDAPHWRDTQYAEKERAECDNVPKLNKTILDMLGVLGFSGAFLALLRMFPLDKMTTVRADHALLSGVFF